MIVPTSAEQLRLADEGPLPGLEQVRADVWALALDMPAGLIRYSLCYLLRDGDGRLHLVDPGWNTGENVRRIDEALQSLGSGIRRLASIAVTHLHADHLGLAPALRELSGAPVVMHEREAAAVSMLDDRAELAARLADEAEAWRVPAARQAEIVQTAHNPVANPAELSGFAADLALRDGEALPMPGRSVRGIHTPGHTAGSLCLLDEGDGLLLTGDHVLPTLHPGLGLGGPSDGNPIAQYLDALERVIGLGEPEVLPGHGYRFRGLGERARAHAAHHLRRAREVQAVLAATPDAPVWAIAERLNWSAGFTGLAAFTLMSALRQTAMHAELVRSEAYPRLVARWDGLLAAGR